jgi:hypothetical protein
MDPRRPRPPPAQWRAALSRSTAALAKDLRIPSPYATGEFWWPPPQPNLALQYPASKPPDPFIATEAAAGTSLKEGNRRMLEDNHAGGGEDARPRGPRSRRSSQGTRGPPGSLLRRAPMADLMENLVPGGARRRHRGCPPWIVLAVNP